MFVCAAAFGRIGALVRFPKVPQLLRLVVDFEVGDVPIINLFAARILDYFGVGQASAVLPVVVCLYAVIRL